MLKFRIGRCAFFAVMPLLVVFVLMGCGNPDPGESNANIQDTGKEEVADADPMDEPEAPGAQDGEDLGEPCKEHHYVVAAGSSVSLEFQILLKREVWMLEAYEKRRFDPEEVSIKDGGDYWTKMGVTREPPSLYIDTIDTTVDLWGVRAEELMEKRAQQPGELTSISKTYGGDTQYKIRFSNEGFGLFTRLGRIWPEENIAEMSEEEVREALGGSLEVEHSDRKLGAFKLPVELISVDAQCYTLTVTYELSFPDDLRTLTKGTKLWQEVRIGNASDSNFTLRFDYDKGKKLFHVFGPWFEESCY